MRNMAYHNVFLDTNIVIDVLCHRQGCAAAAQVLSVGARGDVSLYCSSLTIANCMYICRKTLGTEKTKTLLESLCSIVKISPLGQDEVSKAFQQSAPDFEDTLQYFSALSVNADVLLTGNARHFAFSEVDIMDCQQFLNTYNKQTNYQQ